MSQPEVQPLVDIRRDGTFLADQRDLQAAELHARRFASPEPFKDRKEAGEAADAAKGLAGARKAADENRLAMTKQWRVSTEHVNSHYGEATSKPKAAEEALKRKALAFQRAEEKRAAEAQKAEEDRIAREAKEAEDAAKAAAAKLEAEQTKEAEAAAVAAREEANRAATATAAPAPFTPKRVRGSYSTLSTRTDYSFGLVDFGKVSDSFKVLAETKVREAIKAERAAAKEQERDFNLELIPGVRIFTKEVPVNR